MTVRPFVPWPDKRLSTPAEPVAAITETVRMIWDDMIETMEAMPGVGLAAPQIGVMLRLAVVDASDERGRFVLDGLRDLPVALWAHGPAERRQDFADFAQLAAVAAGQHQRVAMRDRFTHRAPNA